MGVGSQLAESLGELGRREFWNSRTVPAIIGGILTVLGAGGGVFVGGSISDAIERQEGLLATKRERIAAIDRALFEFRVIQSNGLMLGVLSANGAVPADFRASMNRLMFVLREGPTERMLGEITPSDAAAFMAARAAYLRLVEAAKPAEDRATWDAVLSFEMETERRLMRIGEEERKQLFLIDGRKRALQGQLANVTVFGFVLQQLGFFVVLLAGLVERRRDPPWPSAAPAAGTGG
jgi:hypothetical protein